MSQEDKPLYSYRSRFDALLKRLEAGAVCAYEPSVLPLEEITLAPKPGAGEAGKNFIKEAKAFAERFDTSMDIFEYESYIEVRLYANYLSYSGEKLLRFARLASISDNLSVLTHGESLTVSLELETHETYLNGKLI